MDKVKTETTYNEDPQASGYMDQTEPEGSFNVDPEAPILPQSETNETISTEEQKSYTK